ncbi:hypothetical protein BDV25DRAFT_167221 [Aspergillus avenaceus]|uniref:Uncharacterized protein n=1 Tax=Aspergillus avenaceus TaxID=36643 RepID=A0A5N6TDP7_ASPAV|nr:hypothetical protein BDV25DRAFT_167221 [Aspergillus avenaceus]
MGTKHCSYSYQFDTPLQLRVEVPSFLGVLYILVRNSCALLWIASDILKRYLGLFGLLPWADPVWFSPKRRRPYRKGVLEDNYKSLHRY